MIPNLRSIGVAPEEIDTVILTHGHVDHIGGNLDQAGKLAFPNARYVMSRAEWDFWAADPDLAAFKVTAFIDLIRSVARTQLPPIQERLILVEDGDEIVPGIQVVAAPGHTPGHIALFDTRDGSLIAGDAFQTRGGLAVSGMLRPWFPFPAMATWSRSLALGSARRLRALNPSRLAVGHGEVLERPLEAIDCAIAEAARKLSASEKVATI